MCRKNREGKNPNAVETKNERIVLCQKVQRVIGKNQNLSKS